VIAMANKVCMVVSNPFTHDARVNKEAESLAKAGYEVVVYATRDEHMPEEERTGSVLVKRLSVRRYSLFRPNMFRAPFDFFPSLLRIIREKADVYHAHDLDTLLICFLASRTNKAKLIYDSHELFLEMEKSYFSEVWWGKFAAAILIPVWRVEERFCARRANYLITVNDSLKDILTRNLGTGNIAVLMNCPTFKKVSKGREFHKEFSLPKGAKVVLYQGGIMWRRAVRQVADSVEFLSEDTYLIFMGGGGDKNVLIKYVSVKEYFARVKFHEEVSLKELPRYTASADLGVVPLLNVSLNNYYGLPNKLFEYMHAGLPIVASDFPEIKKIVVGEGIGICFNPEDPKDIAVSINKVLGNDKLREKMSGKVLNLARTKYNWEIEEKKLLNIYKEL